MEHGNKQAVSKPTGLDKTLNSFLLKALGGANFQIRVRRAQRHHKDTIAFSLTRTGTHTLLGCSVSDCVVTKEDLDSQAGQVLIFSIIKM
ncbi:hypothetical protein MC885_018136 [Smutsia gigantea]|nr:hypothetical protein MC885_018136 [Smutsia gigantea]